MLGFLVWNFVIWVSFKSVYLNLVNSEDLNFNIIINWYFFVIGIVVLFEIVIFYEDIFIYFIYIKVIFCFFLRIKDYCYYIIIYYVGFYLKKVINFLLLLLLCLYD